MITHTNFHNLFLAASNMKFPPVSDEADIATYVNSCDDYVLFESENLVIKQGNLCRNKLEERGQQLIRTKGNQFVKANGDMVEHFLCTPRAGQIKGSPQFFTQEIPL